MRYPAPRGVFAAPRGNGVLFRRRRPLDAESIGDPRDEDEDRADRCVVGDVPLEAGTVGGQKELAEGAGEIDGRIGGAGELGLGYFLVSLAQGGTLAEHLAHAAGSIGLIGAGGVVRGAGLGEGGLVMVELVEGDLCKRPPIQLGRFGDDEQGTVRGKGN